MQRKSLSDRLFLRFLGGDQLLDPGFFLRGQRERRNLSAGDALASRAEEDEASSFVLIEPAEKTFDQR